MPAIELHHLDPGFADPERRERRMKRFDKVPLFPKCEDGHPTRVTIVKVSSAAARAGNVEAGFYFLQLTVEDTVQLLARRKSVSHCPATVQT